VGDLITTAQSAHGRNRALGERIGRGESLEDILAGSRKVAEGVWTSRAVLRAAKALRIEMPITEQVAEVLFAGKPPRDVVRDLMTRDPKEEA
jgi:glycerol-3-phosphate dehydrogenase (NAD(P)+)